uniref:Rz/Rzl spanin protein n=1 Tax=Pseudomonas phage Arace01 TaxID=3138526 RepID=A0AAU6VZ74_9VIRU
MNPILKGFLILLAVAAILAVPYTVGKNAGKLEEASKWQLDKIALDAEVSKLKDEVKEKEAQNQIATTKVADELAASESRHVQALADLAADYSQRLLKSEGRAGLYKRQSQGSAAERDYLASHAAELDRSLEQGRSLVRELRETVGQRDSTIRLLSEQIRADRRLLTE